MEEVAPVEVTVEDIFILRSRKLYLSIVTCSIKFLYEMLCCCGLINLSNTNFAKCQEYLSSSSGAMRPFRNDFFAMQFLFSIK